MGRRLDEAFGEIYRPYFTTVSFGRRAVAIRVIVRSPTLERATAIERWQNFTGEIAHNVNKDVTLAELVGDAVE